MALAAAWQHGWCRACRRAAANAAAPPVAASAAPARTRWLGSTPTTAAASSTSSLDKLSVSDLKHFLDAAGIDYRDCVEKHELAQRLQASHRRGELEPKLHAQLDAALRQGKASVPETASALGGAGDAPSSSSLLEEERRTISVFERCAPSVVHLTCSTLAQAHPFSLDVSEIPQGTGSGFLWDSDGHVVTNFHVVRRAQRARVAMADTSAAPYEANLVGAEPDKDLAVLRIQAGGEASGRRFVPLRIGSSHGLRVGQKVYAIGNPFGLDQTLTSGIVSGVGRDIQGVTGRTIRGVVQTDAAINPGNSGGPLLDSSGRLVGVNTAILSPSGASSGIGFAVPADTVRHVVNQLIRYGRVTRPALGVSLGAVHQHARRLGLEGATVLSVVPGSGADRAGICGARRTSTGQVVLGDEILAVNGKPVREAEDVLAVLEACEVGDVVHVVVKRDGRRIKLQVHLQAKTD